MLFAHIRTVGTLPTFNIATTQWKLIHTHTHMQNGV